MAGKFQPKGIHQLMYTALSMNRVLIVLCTVDMSVDVEPTCILLPSQRQRLSYEGTSNAKNIGTGKLLLKTNVRL